MASRKHVVRDLFSFSKRRYSFGKTRTFCEPVGWYREARTPWWLFGSRENLYSGLYTKALWCLIIRHDFFFRTFLCDFISKGECFTHLAFICVPSAFLCVPTGCSAEVKRSTHCQQPRKPSATMAKDGETLRSAQQGHASQRASVGGDRKAIRKSIYFFKNRR